jgi:hypothetical protein
MDPVGGKSFLVTIGVARVARLDAGAASVV